MTEYKPILLDLSNCWFCYEASSHHTGQREAGTGSLWPRWFSPGRRKVRMTSHEPGGEMCPVWSPDTWPQVVTLSFNAAWHVSHPVTWPDAWHRVVTSANVMSDGNMVHSCSHPRVTWKCLALVYGLSASDVDVSGLDFGTENTRKHKLVWTSLSSSELSNLVESKNISHQIL